MIITTTDGQIITITEEDYTTVISEVDDNVTITEIVAEDL